MKKNKLLSLIALPVISGSLLPLVSYGANNTTKNIPTTQNGVDENSFSIRVAYDTNLVQVCDLKQSYSKNEYIKIHFKYNCFIWYENDPYDNYLDLEKTDFLIGNTSFKNNNDAYHIKKEEFLGDRWIDCDIFVHTNFINREDIWKSIKDNNGIDIKIEIISINRRPIIIEPVEPEPIEPEPSTNEPITTMPSTKNTLAVEDVADENSFNVRVEYDTKFTEFIDLKETYSRNEHIKIHFRYQRYYRDERNAPGDNYLNRRKSDILIGNTSIKDIKNNVVIKAMEIFGEDWVNCEIFINRAFINREDIWKSIKDNNGIDIKIVIASFSRMPEIIEPVTDKPAEPEPAPSGPIRTVPAAR